MSAWISRLRGAQGLSSKGRVDAKYACMLSTYARRHGSAAAKQNGPGGPYLPAVILPGAGSMGQDSVTDKPSSAQLFDTSDAAMDAFSQALMRFQWHVPGADVSNEDMPVSTKHMLENLNWQKLFAFSQGNGESNKQQQLEQAMMSLRHPVNLSEAALVAPDCGGQESSAAEKRCLVFNPAQVQNCTIPVWPTQQASELHASYTERLCKDMDSLQQTVSTMLKNAVSPISPQAMQALSRVVETAVGVLLCCIT